MRGEMPGRVFFFLALAGLSPANDAPFWSEGDLGAGFCHRTRASASGGISHSFLRAHGSSALRLFRTTWTAELRLADCAVTERPEITRGYLSLCLGAPAGTFSRGPDLRLDVGRLLAPDSPCVAAHGEGSRAPGRRRRDLRLGDASLRRHRRSWIFPGTLWCGMGNKASSYGDLGVFERTDGCCRDHDHCQDTISPFTSDYGLFNSHFYTVSHCECDRRFRQCLLDVNNTISNMVGYTYFNALKVPCFVLEHRMQCVQMNWWGMCNMSQVTQATLRNATKYNSTHPVMETESHHPTDIPGSQSTPEDAETTTVTLPSVTSPEGLGGPTRGLVPRSHTPVLWATPTGTPNPANWDQFNDLENALLAGTTLAPNRNPNNHLLPVLHTQQKDKQPCHCYKHLDDCAYKIPPGVEKFGLQNPGPSTVYHCSCTRSLAQMLRQQQKPNAVESQLLTFISPSCFRMPRAKDCATGGRCSAYFSEAPPIVRALRRRGESKGHGFLDVASTKVKRQDSRPVKRHAPVRLYQRCLRLVRSKPPGVGSWGPI